MRRGCEDVCRLVVDRYAGSRRDFDICVERCNAISSLCGGGTYLDIVETLKILVTRRNAGSAFIDANVLNLLDKTVECLANRCQCIKFFLNAVERYGKGRVSEDAERQCREFAECVVSALHVNLQCSRYTMLRVTNTTGSRRTWILLTHSLTSNSYYDISNSACPLGTWVKGALRTALYTFYAMAILHGTKGMDDSLRANAVKALLSVLTGADRVDDNVRLVNIPRYLLGGGNLASPLLVYPEDRFRDNGCFYRLAVDEVSAALSFYILSLIYYSNARRREERDTRQAPSLALADAAKYTAYILDYSSPNADLALSLLLGYLAGDVCAGGHNIIDLEGASVHVTSLRGQACVDNAKSALVNICMAISAYAQYIISSIAESSS